MSNFAPAFKFDPRRRERINHIRLYIDLIGVTIVRFLLPLAQGSMVHTILAIYSFAAWGTILSVDSTRIPEATTTRQFQRQAWRYTLLWIPLFLSMGFVLADIFHQRLMPHPLSLGRIVAVAIGCYMDEMLFRNTLQAKLRQWGLSKWTAIVLQSAIYAAAIALWHVPLVVVETFFALGVINGWTVHRFRSLWPVSVLNVAWSLLWLG